MQQQQKQQQHQPQQQQSNVTEIVSKKSPPPPTAVTTASATTTPPPSATTTSAKSCPNFAGKASPTASAKIQLKQQKFLAAAAKSVVLPAPIGAVVYCEHQQQQQQHKQAIPPDHHHQQQNQIYHQLHHSDQHKQQQQQQQEWKSTACCPAAQTVACHSAPQEQQQSGSAMAAATVNSEQRAYAPQQLRQSSTSTARPATIDAPAGSSISSSNTVPSATVATTTTTPTTVGQHQHQQQQQLSQRHQYHNFNINNNNNNNYHHYNNHNHHNHHHHNNNNNHHHHYNQHHHNQIQQNQQQQQLQNQYQMNNMAHYKFHNDCQSSVLTYEQVKRLDFVLDQTVPIHGRGQFPTLNVKLKELIRLVKYKLQREHSIEIRDVRLNGGAASYVLAPENSHYNDLDLIFGTDLSDDDQFDVIRDVVLECLKEFIPNDFQCQSSYQMPPIKTSSLKEAYVHKMVKVNDDDRWSLISLGVQQSEANSSKCCSQANCSIQNQQNNCCNQSQQELQDQLQLPKEEQPQQQQQLQHQQQFAVTLTYENEPEGLSNNQSSSNATPDENHKAQAITTDSSTKQHQITYVHYEHLQRNHYQQYQQQEQFPNSIELKFVDRMRRKFEFSVDSFQIILDSLIQFYDYAPLSTVTTHRKSIISHPSSTMINTRPSINKKRCSDCNEGASRTVLGSCRITDDNSGSLSNCKPQAGKDTNYNNNNDSQHDNHHHQIINGFSGSKQCESLLNSNSRSYYQLPLESANTASISSVASSSGCSSSSSIVSSSSSSLSCDEDHEDLYCDVEGTSSSSASTSSLLSSTENFYPTVIGRSEYGNFKEALYHLEKKLIATRSPEEIRGGGLLKYCNLLVKNYKPTNVYQIRTLERYMCSRFFIDFSDLNQQQAKLESYLANHFSDDPILKFDYLTILHNVVQRSTVCLMNHELRLTLNMIRDLAYKLNEQQQQQQQHQQQHHHHHHHHHHQPQLIFGRK